MGGMLRFRGRWLVGVVAAIALLSPAAPVSAADAFRGFTWYHDGETYKTQSSGTAVSAFATGANPNTSFKLRIAPANQEEACPDIGAVDLNPNVRYSNSRGFIATTAGVVNQPPGDYEICFYQIPPGPNGQRFATLPVYLAVV